MYNLNGYIRHKFAGFYVAEEQGLYAKENLDVELVPGGLGIDLFEGVTSGEIDFAVVAADRLITNIHDGAPLIAVATTYRINPFILVAFEDSDIKSPKDFVNQTVSVSPNGYDELQVAMMLSNNNIDQADVNIVPRDSNSLQDFIDGDIDVITSFAAGGFLTLRDAIGDRPIIILWPGDYDVNFYSDTIITNQTFLEEHPDVVLRFLRATLEGHRKAVEKPDIAISATMNYADIQNEALQREMLVASIPLMHTGDAPIGVMECKYMARDANFHDRLRFYFRAN